MRLQTGRDGTGRAGQGRTGRDGTGWDRTGQDRFCNRHKALKMHAKQHPKTLPCKDWHFMEVAMHYI